MFKKTYIDNLVLEQMLQTIIKKVVSHENNHKAKTGVKWILIVMPDGLLRARISRVEVDLKKNKKLHT